MSDDDYRDVPRKNSEIRELAARLRSHFGVADTEHVDVIDCAGRGDIWTVKGIKPLQLEIVSDLCLSEIKFGHIGGEVRRGMASAQCGQRHE
jgi:hypothetical protein